MQTHTGNINPETVDYRGMNRVGAHVVGRMGDDHLADKILDMYEARWRLLTVERDGEEVGGISLHPDTGERIWWSE